MFEIVGDIIGSVFWGLFLSAVTVGLLYFVPKGFSARYHYSLSGILTLCVGFLFFLFQFVLMVGAIKSKGYVNKAEAYIQAGIQVCPDGTTALSEAQVTEMVDSLCEEYGFLKGYKESLLEEVTERGGEVVAPAEWTSILMDLIRTEISFYIFRRVLWVLGGMFAIVVILARLAHQAAKDSYARAYSDYYSGGF